MNAHEEHNLAFFSLNSMQQGKMFFFIGVIMALIQGGYARRIKPGHHIKAVRMVGVCLHVKNSSWHGTETAAQMSPLLNCVSCF